LSYLDRLDATPEAERFPLVWQWINGEDPRPFFAELRERRPVLATPVCTLVARFDDVIEVLRLPTVFTVQPYVNALGTYMLAQDETPDHALDKSVMTAMLDRRDLPRVRAFVAAETDRVLDGAGERIELVGGITRYIPVRLVQEYFGFAESSAAKLQEWSYWAQMDGFHNYPWDLGADHERIHAEARRGLTEMKDYLIGLLQGRVAALKAGRSLPDDIVARLLQSRIAGPVGFPPEKLLLNVGGLLIGAVETSSQATAQVIEWLLQRPPRLEAAIAAAQQADPRAFDGHVWEALRFAPMSHYLFRKSAAAHVFGRGQAWETTIPAGTHVLPLIGSAGFDPVRFARPDAFDPARPIHSAFHFGWGHHACLGGHIAEVLIPEMVRRVLLRPGIRLETPIDRRGGPFPESLGVAWASGGAV
jgi:cytochrome P450